MCERCRAGRRERVVRRRESVVQRRERWERPVNIMRRVRGQIMTTTEHGHNNTPRKTHSNNQTHISTHQNRTYHKISNNNRHKCNHSHHITLWTLPLPPQLLSALTTRNMYLRIVSLPVLTHSNAHMQTLIHIISHLQSHIKISTHYSIFTGYTNVCDTQYLFTLPQL